MDNVVMVRNVNSPMVIMRWLTKSPKMKNTNLSPANHSMRKVTVCTVRDACLDMKIDALKRLLNLITCLSFKNWNINSRILALMKKIWMNSIEKMINRNILLIRVFIKALEKAQGWVFSRIYLLKTIRFAKEQTLRIR